MIAKRVVSGGQTGVDRAALDWSLANGQPCGGWAPRGWIAEDGTLDERYRAVMQEHPKNGYRYRTRQNVIDSDATLLISMERELTGGTERTQRHCASNGKPSFVIVVGLAEEEERKEIEEAARWLLRIRPDTLNIAGPRESKSPGIYTLAVETLNSLDETLNSLQVNT